MTVTWNFVLFSMMVLVASRAALADDVTFKVPDECETKGFCAVKPDNFEELEKRMIAALPPFLKKDFSQRDNSDSVDQGNRYSLIKDWPNCPYVNQSEWMHQYVYDNRTHFDVIVQTSMYRQKIEIIKCAPELIADSQRNKQECFFPDMQLSASEVSSVCETVYASRNLYVFDLKTSKVYQKSFSIPVCCTCVLNNI